MKETLKLIKKYIPEICTIKINDDNKNKEFIHYDLYNEKEKDIGYLYLSNLGEIKSYLYKNNDNKQSKRDINNQEIKEKANQFINEFYTEQSLTLLSVTKTSQNYEVIFEEKEREYDLYVPGTGIEMSFDLLGTIEKVEQKIKTYEIAYPNTIITPEEAKIKFLDGLNLDLKISKPLNHSYYQLYYRINEKLKNVPASGNNGEIIKKKQKLESLDEFETSSKNLLRIVGLNENYKRVAKKSKLNFKIEVWSKYSKKALKQLNFDINDPQIGVIKYKIDKHTKKIVQICDGEVLEEDYVEKISESQAYDKALDFLFTLYPKAEELFDVLELEKNEETKNGNKNEPNYTYYFNRIHDSIEIENQIANIGVGQYTGMINQFCAPNVTEKELAHIYVFAKLSESEAKTIYAEQLEMNLNFIKKAEENGSVNYELVYLPSYPNKKVEINLIDAHSGTIIDREVTF